MLNPGVLHGAVGLEHEALVPAVEPLEVAFPTSGAGRYILEARGPGGASRGNMKSAYKITGLYALFVLKIEPSKMFAAAVFGAFAMLICAIPGQFMWRAAFKRRVLEPLRDLGGVMIEAGKGDLTVRATAPNDDEIGLLVNECNSLITSLSGIAGQVRRSSEAVTNAATQLSASSEEA